MLEYPDIPAYAPLWLTAVFVVGVPLVFYGGYRLARRWWGWPVDPRGKPPRVSR